MPKNATSASDRSRASARPTAKFWATAEIHAFPAFSPFSIAVTRKAASDASA